MPLCASNDEQVYEAGDKKRLETTFLDTVGAAVNRLTRKAVFVSEVSRCPVNLGTGLAVPDLVAVSYPDRASRLQAILAEQGTDDDGDSKSDSDESDSDSQSAAESEQIDNSADSDLSPRLVLVVEVKRRNLVNHGSDLVQLYKSGSHVKDAVYQITGYQAKYGCRYGILTTYLYSYATRLDMNGTLYLSKPFESKTSGHLSTLNMVFYLVSMIEQDLLGGGWETPTNLVKIPDRSSKRKTGDDSDASGTGKKPRASSKKGTSASSKKGSSSKKKTSSGKANGLKLKLWYQMVGHENRETWQAQDEVTGEWYAVKAFATEGERDFELECYDLLKPLQGRCIPVLIDRDYRGVMDDTDTPYAMVLSWVGTPGKGNYMTLPTDGYEQARKILLQMHKLGVAHGDVRAQNMNYDIHTKKLYIYDFGQAVIRGEPEFRQECRNDLETINQCIAESKTPAARARVYL